jgi:iron(III) transport system substrate-binding protein
MPATISGGSGMVARLLFGVLCLLSLARLAFAADLSCPEPRQMDGFKTCADVTKAEQEGDLVVYSTDPEVAQQTLLASFHAAFPKIKTNYLRLQAGALYAKLLAERQGQVYSADVVQLSDVGFAADFQKRGGYMHYISPEMAAYKPEYKSKPEGYWNWGAVVVAGIAYNPTLVPASEAPRNYMDLLDPKWTDNISVKVTISGLQHVTWYVIRKLHGPEYWEKFALLRPHAFDSYVQQFDRLVSGQDKIVMTAQYSGYLIMKAKGAPVEFVYPPEGLIATPQPYGLVKEAPHPEAARLFMDWFLGVPGQTAAVKALYYHSPRSDVPPPPGGEPVTKFKLLFPEDWDGFIASHAAYAREWNKLTGLK